MSKSSKTVAELPTGLDLFADQQRDVAAMRSSLLNFDRRDPSAARKAIQNVTLLRVYHQLKRIVRYTEMMDKIEDRIYQSIDSKLLNSSPDDETLYLQLIPIQERLQKAMVESHKLLEPYLTSESLTALEVPQEDTSTSFASMLLEQESREKVRTGVQQLMNIINTFDTNAEEVKEVNPTQDVQAKAQEILAELDAKEDLSNE